MKPTSKALLLALLASAGLVYLGYRVAADRPSDLLKKSVFPAPAFTFTAADGKPFDSAALSGKVWVADFIFTRCAGSCPLLSQQMRNLQAQWKGNAGFRLVSFTVDPGYDTAPVLKRYAEGLSADPAQWVFLTGPKKDLYAMIRNGFKVTAERDPQGKPGFDFIHSTRLVLVDGRGMVRGLYDGDEDGDVAKLRRDVKFLMGSGGRF